LGNEAALVPLARVAAKVFGDRNGVVDVNHAVKRLAEAKARYGMTNAELEQYVRTGAPSTRAASCGISIRCRALAGSCRAMLQKHRRRHQVAQEPSPSTRSPAEGPPRGTKFRAVERLAMLAY